MTQWLYPPPPKNWYKGFCGPLVLEDEQRTKERVRIENIYNEVNVRIYGYNGFIFETDTLMNMVGIEIRHKKKHIFSLVVLMSISLFVVILNINIELIVGNLIIFLISGLHLIFQIQVLLELMGRFKFVKNEYLLSKF